VWPRLVAATSRGVFQWRLMETLTRRELGILSRLETPSKIQDYLDRLLYSPEERYRSPRSVMRDRMAHCFDGAIFAAAALRRVGYPPLVLDMLPNERDDDHILALFRRNGCWGAVAKSNYVGLRFREPVYRTLRELVMSYFEQYHNVLREKTLRAYTRPLNLAAFDRLNWMVRDEPMDLIALRLDRQRRFRVITPRTAASLSPVDRRSYKAGMLYVNRAGLFRVKP
jgi:hypothetical protein